ncbi:MAG: exodeoxyribonuclease VII small subunit [Firmicutes bacterium]|jgi:exodeoxyribonuclease VII small subunit|nr:exodeoxyribonuclease VII small subunit [Bacillota bacterium]NBI63228.1 exodeoxyribonuclease VII small subunit [Clostridiales bacterium]
MTAAKKTTFEEALAKLEQASENLKKDNITLEDALKNFEQGVAYYDQCSEILNNAKQKIETWSK